MCFFSRCGSVAEGDDAVLVSGDCDAISLGPVWWRGLDGELKFGLASELASGVGLNLSLVLLVRTPGRGAAAGS